VAIEEPKLLFIGHNKALAATWEAAGCSKANKASNKAAEQDLNTPEFYFLSGGSLHQRSLLCAAADPAFQLPYLPSVHGDCV
jgi:hypothetical protein